MSRFEDDRIKHVNGKEDVSKENEDPTDVTWTWSKNVAKIKKDKTSMYSTAFISPPHSFVADMLCRMFGKPDNTTFPQYGCH